MLGDLKFLNGLNGFFTAASEPLFAPLADWPLTTLVIWSAITGVLMSVVFRYTSNQQALGNVVDRSQGHLLAIKLFKDDLPGMFRSLGHIFRNVLLRLWYSLGPLLVMIVPLIIVLTQLALRYEHRPLAVGETAVVHLQAHPDAWRACENVQLEPSTAFVSETEPLRDQAQNGLYWRIRATQTGPSILKWKLGAKTIEKQLMAADDTRLRLVSRRRPGPHLSDRTLYPGEPGFSEDSLVQAIDVYYPRRETPVFGFNLPWWLTFFVVSIMAALAMQPIIKVRF